MNVDINYIIQKSLKGDKLYQEKLLKNLHPLIFNNIYKYYSFDDKIVEDLLQEGYVVILEALRSFDESRNVHFLQYVKIKLKFFYKNYYRNHKRYFQIESLDQKIENYNNGIKYESIFDKNNIPMEEKYENTEEIIELIKYFKRLSRKEQDVLYLYYFKKLSMSEISKRLNICYRTAIGRKYTAIKRLKKMMAAKDGGENNG